MFLPMTSNYFKYLFSFLKVKKYFHRDLIFYCILFGLVILPFFWFSQDLYLLGEDDTGLSYYNPLGTLKIYLSSWCCGDALAKVQMPGGSAIFTFLLYLAKLITFGKINLQLLTFSFILSFSFLFIVRILELLNNNKKSYAYYIAGLFYCLSAYFVIVEYYYLMPSTFVIVLAPILTFYLLKAIKTGSNKPLLIGAVWSLFLSRAITTPVFINFFAFLFLFVLLQGYFYYGLRKLKITFLSYLKLVIFIVFINAIIFIPTFYTFITSTENTVSIAIANRTSHMNSMLKSLEAEFNIDKINDSFINLYPENLNKSRGWRDYDLYPKYFNKVKPLMYIVVLLAFAGLLMIPKNKRKIILPILILFITTSLFLFVDVFGVFKRFYIYLMIHTPIFNMNRHPSMRFDVPFIFYYSFAVGISLYYLFKKIGPKYSKMLLIICLLVLLTINYSFISGKVFTEKLKGGTARAMDFNDNYKKLVKDFPSYIHDDAKLLLFPLGYGFGAFIQGQNDSQIYRSTITGFKNFTGYDLLGNLKVLTSSVDKSTFLDAKKYYFKYSLQSFFNLDRKLNIKYIIYSKDINSLKKWGEIIPAFTYLSNKNYYGPADKDTLIYENEGYSIYKVKNYNEISKFTSNNIDTRIYFNKIADFMYLLKIKTTHLDKIRMHEGFSKDWNVYEIKKQDFECKNPVNYAKDYPNIYECKHINDNVDGNIKLMKMFGQKIYELPHEPYNNYANEWEMNTNGEYKYMAIILGGQKYYIIGMFLSLLILCIYGYLIIKK